jgi:mono/diheme cytochrome c family protein
MTAGARVARRRRSTSAVAAASLALGLHAGMVLAQAGPSYAEVAPILRERCVACHQGEAAPLGLRLDSYAGAMKGSQKGPVIKPGDARASELAKRLRGESQPRMPLTGPPWLSGEQIALIERWIAAGATEGARAAAAPAPAKKRRPDDPVTYAEVAPILVGRCAKCHSANGIMGTPPEGYRLDTLAATLDPSDRARVVPGNPSGSELVRRIRGQARPRMPFDGPPYLEQAQIALVEQWIAQGARDAQGKPAGVPVGARVRLHGKLAGPSMLDELQLRGQAGRVDRRTGVGDYVELRGTVARDGGIVPERIRSR